MSVEGLWTVLEERLLPVFADYRRRIGDLPIEIKPDRTLLTEADVKIEDLITTAIREQEPNAVIIAEEDERTGPRAEVTESHGRLWIIDPIDGTAQFVRGDEVEFCSVVCLLDGWKPANTFVLAPELGVGGAPLLVTASVQSRTVFLNARQIDTTQMESPSRWLSVTRSTDDPARPIEAAAARDGYHVKTRTTSQTIDMVRTALDISSLTDPPLQQFSLFWRRDQKLWDGAAGLCLAAATGLKACDEQGEPILIELDLLSQQCPTFPSTVVGRPEVVAWFLGAGNLCTRELLMSW